MFVKFGRYHTRQSHLLTQAFVQDGVDFQSEALNSVIQYGAWIDRVGFSGFPLANFRKAHICNIVPATYNRAGPPYLAPSYAQAA